MSNDAPKSLTILGRQPALGLAELESLYGAAAVSSVAPGVAGLSLDFAEVDFPRLGGSTRLAAVWTELPSTNWKVVEKMLASAVKDRLHLKPEGKLQLGLSVYGLDVTVGKLNAAGLTIKKIVRAQGKSMRLIPNNELELNTAQVVHNHLTGPQGWELLLIATSRNTTLVARTVLVQDIDSYTQRDRGRPKRDARVGMLPPKLAQTLINLTNPAAGGTVLDPFCGTGVLLQEAILMGFHAYGTDLEQRMVDFSRENLDWLSEQFNTAHNFKLDAGDATSYQWSGTIDAVATETYLGRPFTEQPTGELIAQTSAEVNLILKKFLKNLHGQLAPGTPLCLAVPAWAVGQNQFKHLPLVDQIDDLGYNRVRFEHARDADLLYYREDQYTARELLVLTRK